MKIAMSCNKTKECCKCNKPIYTNEIRRNRNNGTSEHLQCDCENLGSQCDTCDDYE